MPDNGKKALTVDQRQAAGVIHVMTGRDWSAACTMAEKLTPQAVEQICDYQSIVTAIYKGVERIITHSLHSQLTGDSRYGS